MSHYVPLSPNMAAVFVLKTDYVKASNAEHLFFQLFSYAEQLVQ